MLRDSAEQLYNLSKKSYEQALHHPELEDSLEYKKRIFELSEQLLKEISKNDSQ